MFWRPRLKRSLHVGIDLGYARSSCWMGTPLADPEESWSIVSCQRQASAGMLAGGIGDASEFNAGLMKLLTKCELVSGIQVHQVTLTLSDHFFQFSHHHATITVRHPVVSSQEIHALTQHIKQQRPDQCIQLIAVNFKLDNQDNLTDPRGLVGQELTGHFHGVWMEPGLYASLTSCLRQSGITARALLCGSYAHSLACTTTDDKQQGIILIDWGHGGTRVSVFVHGAFVAQHSIGTGGVHLTQRLAQHFGLSLSGAERIKILYGAALLSQKDHHDAIDLGERQGWYPDSTVPRATIIRVLQSSLEDIVSQIKNFLQTCPFGHNVSRVILSGGGSQLSGLRELCQRMLGRSVRSASPDWPPHVAIKNLDECGTYGAMIHQPSRLEAASESRLQNLQLFSWLRKKM